MEVTSTTYLAFPSFQKLSKFAVHVDTNCYTYSMRGVAVYLSCSAYILLFVGWRALYLGSTSID